MPHNAESGVGNSSHENGKKAGEEAIKNALKNVEDGKVVLSFISSKYDPEKVLESIKEHTDLPVIGGTTAGEIINYESKTESVSVMVLGGEKIDIMTGIAQNVEGNEVSKGAESVIDALEKFKEEKIPVSSVCKEDRWNTFSDLLGIAFGCGLKGDNQQIMAGVTNILPTATIGGGWAGDDWKLEETAVFHNGKVRKDSFVIGMIKTGVKTGIGVRHGLSDTEKEYKITKSDGNWIEELDGKPALDVYEEEFGKKARNAQFLLNKPFGIEMGGKEYSIREPLAVDTENKRVMYSEHMKEGWYVKMMDAKKDDVKKGAEKAIEEAMEDAGNPEDIAAVIIHDCACRWFFLENTEERENELEIIREKVGEDVPVAGWYTYGEIAYPGCMKGVRHQNMVIQIITNEEM